MPLPSIADLERAVAAGALDGCLERMGDEGRRSAVRRALEVDRGLWTEFPASLGSCLLARTLDAPALSDLHASWTRELGRRQVPWIRPLRSLPIPPGLLAELRDDQVAAAILPQTYFESDDVLTSVPRQGGARRWAWRRGELSIERGEWTGPAQLFRSAEQVPAALPSPPGASAEARFTADGRRLLVYGTLDEERGGGYLWILDPVTLAVQRKIATRHRVRQVLECARDDVLVLSTSGGLVGCIGSQTRELLHAPQLARASLAPSGDYLATLDKVLRIWSTFDLLRRGPPPFRSRIRTCFDPDGDRLLSGEGIFDGRTGQAVAEVALRLGPYLMGGPAHPWLSLGTRNLMCIYNGLQVWDTHSGAPLEIEKLGVNYPYWFSLAHDRTGTRFAALRRGAAAAVLLHELPSGRILREIQFSLRGQAIALSPDGSMIAVQDDHAVEIRSDQGALLRFLAHGGMPDREKRRRAPWTISLRFSTDGHRLARLDPDGVWRIAPPNDVAEELVVQETELDSVPGFAPPRPDDWSIQTTAAKTIFTHRPTGTPIAFPALGPWVSNPRRSHIVACDDAHLELRSP